MDDKKAAKNYWEEERPHSYPQSLEYSKTPPHLGARIRKYWIDKLLSEALQSRKFSTCLDVGCAEGLYLHNMAFHASLAIGIDFSLSYLKRAKRSRILYSRSKDVEVDFVLADAENLPFRDYSFDLVLCSEVLEHLIHWRKCVGELTRTCSKHMIVSFPPHTSPFQRLAERVTQFVRPETKNRNAGEDFFIGFLTIGDILHEFHRNSFHAERKINSHPIFSSLQAFFLISTLYALSPFLAVGLADIVERLDRKLGCRQNRVLELLSGSTIIELVRT